MTDKEKPVVLFEGTQRLFKHMNNAAAQAPWLKLIFVAIVTFVSIFMLVSQDWMGTTKKAAVDTARIDHQEKLLYDMQTKLPQDYLRKDVADIKLSGIERRLDRIEENQLQMQQTLDRMLIELKRR